MSNHSRKIGSSKISTHIGFVQVDLVGELETHLVEGTRGPVPKPVEDTPVEEGGGGGRPVLQTLRGGVHGEHHMKVGHYLIWKNKNILI